jgi:hypothetical protein
MSLDVCGSRVHDTCKLDISQTSSKVMNNIVEDKHTVDYVQVFVILTHTTIYTHCDEICII